MYPARYSHFKPKAPRRQRCLKPTLRLTRQKRKNATQMNLELVRAPRRKRKNLGISSEVFGE